MGWELNLPEDGLPAELVLWDLERQPWEESDMDKQEACGLNIWSLASGPVWEGLGCVALLE